METIETIKTETIKADVVATTETKETGVITTTETEE